MEQPFIQVEGTVDPYQTYPTPGFEFPFHKDTGKQYPYCCEYHKQAAIAVNKWFNEFPNCCESCRKTVERYGLKKTDFADLPNMILRKLAYTEHLISVKIETENWYKDIKEYIEYCNDSFGSPPFGIHLYWSRLIDYIKIYPEPISEDKRQQLIKYLTSLRVFSEEEGNRDLNLLYDTYQRWYKMFPFDLSFFRDLEPKFKFNLNSIVSQSEKNQYSGLTVIALHSKQSLINHLVDRTNQLITEINTISLYDKGLLTEPKKIELEIILAERRMKLKKGYTNNSKDEEQRYRKMLKEWFADEKEFIQKITPLVKVLPPQPISPKATAVHYALAYFFDTTVTGRQFPNGKSRLEEVGNRIMGAGKGNTFYKQFNQVKGKDLNSKKNLVELGGEDWREVVLNLCENKEEVEKYLTNKKL